jgi:hypothetical protein
MTSTREQAQHILDKLRQEPFNQETTNALLNHPFVVAAGATEGGQLTVHHLRAFVAEQFHIQHSDAISFAVLAGCDDFRPTSRLTQASLPKIPLTVQDGQRGGLFYFLLGGELHAASLLLKMGQVVFETETDVANLEQEVLTQYQTHPKAQAYPSYWSRLALGQHSLAGAAAIAINFPAWGQACAKIMKGMRHNGGEYDERYIKQDGQNDGLDFIEFFATPIPGLDEMVLDVMEEELKSRSSSPQQQQQSFEEIYSEIRNHVRLLQAYEVMFWDACWESGNNKVTTNK